jgi:hypothetical protein
MIAFAPIIMIKSYLKWLDGEKKATTDEASPAATVATSSASATPAVSDDASKKPAPSLQSVLASFPDDLMAMKDRAPFYLALGSVVGFATGLFGFGGGLLMATTLTLAGEMPQQAVLGTCLATLILPGVVGSVTHYNMGTMRVKMVPALSAGVFIGATLGSQSAMGTHTFPIHHLL